MAAEAFAAFDRTQISPGALAFFFLILRLTQREPTSRVTALTDALPRSLSRVILIIFFSFFFFFYKAAPFLGRRGAPFLKR